MKGTAASPYEYVETILDVYSKLPSAVERMPTFMEIARYPHYENACSNILAFYLDPENPHGLGSLLLDALACMLGVEGEGAGGHVSVEREVVTRKGNRIDILVESDESVILVENKIRAATDNPFLDYSRHLDSVAGGRGKHKLFLTLSPSGGEGNEWGFVNRTHTEFTVQVRSMLGHYVSRADTRYLTLLLDFLNTMENLKEGSRMDDRFRNLLSERGEEVVKLLGDIKVFKDELRGKVRELGSLVEVGEYGNVKQWFYRESQHVYDALVHDIGLGDHLPVFIDTTIYPKGWEISLGVREGGSEESLRELLRGLAIPFENDGELVHSRFAYEEDLENIATVVSHLVSTIATAEEEPG